MNGVQYSPYTHTYAGSGGQFDPQGFLGSLLAGAAGGFLGKHIGGSTGQTIGSWAGRIGGGFLPFAADPTGGGAAPSDLELQGFWSVLRKIGQGVGTGVDIGRQFGLFQAGQPGAGGMTATPSDLELQGFWSVLRKIGQGVGTGLDIGRQFGLFQAGQPGAAQPYGAVSQEQMVALLQQALPALQAMAQAQQQASRPYGV